MAGPSLGELHRAAGWLVLAYVLAVSGFCLWAVDADSFLFSILLIPWIAAPVLATAVAAGVSSTRLGAITYLTLEAGLILFSIWATVDLLLYGNSTSGVAILLLPIPEWMAFGLVFVLALLFGWRMRPDVLEDATPLTPPPRA